MLSLSSCIFVAVSFFPHKEIGGRVEESLSPLQFWCYCPSSQRMFFFKYFLGDFFYLFSYYIHHSFICRPTDSTVPTDAGIEPRTVATDALAVRRSNHLARSHPLFFLFFIKRFTQNRTTKRVSEGRTFYQRLFEPHAGRAAMGRRQWSSNDLECWRRNVELCHFGSSSEFLCQCLSSHSDW
jgi:hypothetical protein